ncbi:MAG TPA: hypothetical protein VH306_01145 [Gaiellaceae bacterium]
MTDPARAPEVADFLERLDYSARIEGGRIEATAPDDWPEALGMTALQHFLLAWNRANPEAEAHLGASRASVGGGRMPAYTTRH